MQSGLRVVVDTNVFFMYIYRSDSKAGDVIRAALKGKITITSADSVKEELIALLKRKFDLTDLETENVIDNLPVEWYGREIYFPLMSQTAQMPHKPDRPLVALALLLNCGVLSANYRHFRHVDKLIKVWDIDELLEVIKKGN